MTFFITFPVSNWIKVLLTAFFLIRIICYINSKDWDIRITSIEAFFIMFLPLLLFFLRFLNVIRSLCVFKKIIHMFRLWDFWLRPFNFWVLINLIETCIYYLISTIIVLAHITTDRKLYFGFYFNSNSFLDYFFLITLFLFFFINLQFDRKFKTLIKVLNKKIF